MHENVLQSIGNRQMPTYNYHGHNFASKTSAIVQPMFPSTATPEKENQPMKPIAMSPVLPGTASITHNVTRMLQDDGTSAKRSPSGSENRYAPYTTAHFMAYRQKMLNKTDNNRSTNSEDDSILDVENESHEHLRSSDMPSFTDTSLSTQGSSSPQSNGSSTSPSGSAKSSPSSTGEPVTTPDSETKVGKKKVRTNYTNEQVQTLLKIFHENPYPESEHMERIALDLGVAENKIKIWFQNKRARWRRRVNDNMTGFPYMPMSPMLSPVNPYGFMPTGHMMTSSPPQMMPGYFNYAAMQPPFSPNNNVQANSRVHPAYPIVTSSTQQYPGTSTYQQSNMAASTYPSRTSPTQPGMMSQAYRNLQYPQYLYPQQNNQHGV